MSDCLFCKIINNEIPSHKIYEDDRVIAFLDIHPVKSGHTLVVPKAHAQNLSESSDEDLNATMEAIRKIVKAMENINDIEGFNVTSNVGQAAGQIILHTHFHIIPRHRGDGLVMWSHQEVTQQELSGLAQKISSLLL